MVGHQTLRELGLIPNIQQQLYFVCNIAAVPMFFFNLIIFILCMIIYAQSHKKPSFAFIGNLSLMGTLVGVNILFMSLVRSGTIGGQNTLHKYSVSIQSRIQKGKC